MSSHDLEITISKSGNVRVHVKGAKGGACMDYAKWLSSIVGKIEDKQMTSESYEPDEKNRIQLKQELSNQDR